MLHRAISPRACGCDGWVRSTAGWSIETVENSKYPTQHHDTDRPCPWKELPLMRNRFSEAPKRFICRRTTTPYGCCQFLKLRIGGFPRRIETGPLCRLKDSGFERGHTPHW